MRKLVLLSCCLFAGLALLIACGGSSNPNPIIPVPPTVDVDMLTAALGTTPTDRQMAGLPSRTRTTIPPPFREDIDPGDDDTEDPNSVEDELAPRRRKRGDA